MSNLKLPRWKRTTLLPVLSPILICNGHGEQFITFLFVITFTPFKTGILSLTPLPCLNKPSSVNLFWETIFSLITSVSILWTGSDYAAPFLLCVKPATSASMTITSKSWKFAINRQQHFQKSLVVKKLRHIFSPHVYPNYTICKIVCQFLKHIKETYTVHLWFSVIKT